MMAVLQDACEALPESDQIVDGVTRLSSTYRDALALAITAAYEKDRENVDPVTMARQVVSRDDFADGMDLLVDALRRVAAGNKQYGSVSIAGFLFDVEHRFKHHQPETPENLRTSAT